MHSCHRCATPLTFTMVPARTFLRDGVPVEDTTPIIDVSCSDCGVGTDEVLSAFDGVEQAVMQDRLVARFRAAPFPSRADLQMRRDSMRDVLTRAGLPPDA